MNAKTITRAEFDAARRALVCPVNCQREQCAVLSSRFVSELLDRALVAEARAQKYAMQTTMELSYEDMRLACANVGVDLDCGVCAAIFYTGDGSRCGNHTCSSKSRASELEAALREACDELDKDVS